MGRSRHPARAQLTDGHVLRGEAAIDVRREHPQAEIDYVYLDHPAYPTAAALDALRSADLVVIGPGDLFTSIIPNLLVDGISEAIAEARHRVFVVNLMTKAGESDNFRASTFVERLLDYLRPASLDQGLVAALRALGRPYAGTGLVVLVSIDEQITGIAYDGGLPAAVEVDHCAAVGPRWRTPVFLLAAPQRGRIPQREFRPTDQRIEHAAASPMRVVQLPVTVLDDHEVRPVAHVLPRLR